ncbi:MAG: YceH family protein [Proteobacteria bacterium]|nr:YceH family protein [Pseudomonadota bacterium]MBU1688959.1 YceH family protein [Pseudomonadota bacterium]
MDYVLNETETRVLGALLEKEMATPEYYPLSLNALTNACNQKSNRDPVVSFSDEEVVRAIDGLKEKRLARQSDVSRVPKYEECFIKSGNFIQREAAVICLLLLRGPQTTGELRSRSTRLHEFNSLVEVDETLVGLIDLGVVVKMERQPGRKEHRYMHLFSGEPVPGDAFVPVPEVATLRVRAENERIAALEDEVSRLTTILEAFQEEFVEFKRQFE